MPTPPETTKAASHRQGEEESVSFTANSIDATQMQGGFLNWQFKGDGDGPIVSPARKKTTAITLQPNAIACLSQSGKTQTFTYTPTAKEKHEGGKPDDDKDPQPIYTQDETVTLSGPNPAKNDKVEIDLTGNESGLITHWVADE